MDQPDGEIGLALHAFRRGGGMERYALDLVRAFVKLGISPHVYANWIDQRLPETTAIKPHTLGSFLIPRQLQSFRLSAGLRRARARDDVSFLIGCCRNRDSELAICGGTHIGFLRSTKKQAGLWDRLEVRLERDFYTLSSAVIAHSRLMQDELARFYNVPSEKIHVVYPPVSSENFSPTISRQRDQLRDQLNFPKNETLFLFVSTGHKRKGFDLLRQYFEAARAPVHLLVAGRPVMSKSPRISHIGYRNDLADVYRAVDFTIHPSHYEPFGLACVESVQCGTPIIISDRVGASEVISDKAKVVMPTIDHQGLAEAIESACLRRDRLQEDSGPESILYDPDPALHVQTLLGIARSARAAHLA
ncbi:MAG: glycosyltransferase family 4 protein [Acidiferrobacteraceae bacterium]